MLTVTIPAILMMMCTCYGTMKCVMYIAFVFNRNLIRYQRKEISQGYDGDDEFD